MVFPLSQTAGCAVFREARFAKLLNQRTISALCAHITPGVANIAVVNIDLHYTPQSGCRLQGLLGIVVAKHVYKYIYTLLAAGILCRNTLVASIVQMMHAKWLLVLIE